MKISLICCPRAIRTSHGMAGEYLFVYFQIRRSSLISVRTPRPLLDSNGVVFACLVGRPNDPTYDDACRRIYAKLEVLSTGNDSAFPIPDPASRRGSFSALNVGITHGTGTKHPVNLHDKERKNSTRLAAVIEKLLEDEDVKMVAAFASCRLISYFYLHVRGGALIIHLWF